MTVAGHLREQMQPRDVARDEGLLFGGDAAVRAVVAGKRWLGMM